MVMVMQAVKAVRRQGCEPSGAIAVRSAIVACATMRKFGGGVSERMELLYNLSEFPNRPSNFHDSEHPLAGNVRGMF